MEPEDSVLCSQPPTSGSSPILKSHESTARRHTYVCESDLTTVLSSHLGLQVASYLKDFL
jgi:hypothetical protein